jgi:polyisoprenoid-binding protein YceI
VIRASGIDGEVHFDSNKPQADSIAIRIPTASLIADEREMRSKYHVEKEIGADDRKKIQATMLGAEQLDAKRFPEISFRSTKIEREGKERYMISGVLTLHGQTQPVTFEARAMIEQGVLHASGSFPIKQSDFRIEPYSAALGSIRNKDEVRIEFSIVASEKTRGAS